MMGLLILTYYVIIPYQLWQFSHKFLGLAFVIGSLHGLLIPSDISLDPLLKNYTFIICSVALLAFTYRTLLGRILVKRYHYTIAKTIQASRGITELTLTPSADDYCQFVPGQFVFLTFPFRPSKNESHPFSISSKPEPGMITIAIKNLGDHTKKDIPLLPVGTPVLVEGPYGKFADSYAKLPKQVWIAGGIGITPFASMALALPPQNTVRIDLYYACKDETEALYLTNLITIANANPSLRVIPWYSKQLGRLTGEGIAKYSTDLAHSEVFVCGPPAMMTSIKRQLIKLGVPKKQLHSEEFSMQE
jgi:predicted ferric reductase